MKLSQLLSLYSEYQSGDDPHVEISGLCSDSREIRAGCVFVAVKGFTHDGHQYLPLAQQKGAAALVVEDKTKVPKDFHGAVVVVPNSRLALEALASHYYGYPAREMFCVGVTGTNGKTTTTHMIEHVLNEFGWPTGVMGTIDHHIGKHHWESAMTTPDPLVLQKRLREFVALGAKAAAFEVSSHALDQGRVDHIPFNVAVFTNLTRDHLDYHKNMENYFQAKEKLFFEVLEGSDKPEVFAILNRDDEASVKFQVCDRARTWFYGQDRDADFCFKVKKADFSGTEFQLKTPRGELEMKLKHPGLHNVYNATAAIAVGLAAGASLETCVEAFTSFHGVKGRVEPVPNQKQIHVFVDYAHTDDALVSVLKSLADIRFRAGLQNRIITVFGCGGDRDTGKRPLMAKAACEYSDLVVITSDNPRTEDPQKIIDEIVKGVPNGLVGKSVFCQADRRLAIEQALKLAKPQDVVLIAGKGHEEYQIVGTEKRDFSDRKVVEEILK